MTITILIVTFNSEGTIYNCIDSIENSYPIVVIENSNNHSFQSELTKKYKNVKCILSGQNVGFAKAINLGLLNIKTDLVFSINPDTILNKNTITNLLSEAKKVPNFSLMSPIVSNDKNVNYGFFKNKNLDINKELFEVDYLKGFALLFNKKNNNFLFDENYFLYFEEIDYCLNLRKNNKKIFLTKKSNIEHLGGKSTNKNLFYEMELNRNWHHMWSKFYFYKKNFNFYIAYQKTLGNFLGALVKFTFYSIILKKFKAKVYFARLSGLLNSYLGRKSFYRPKLLNN